MPTITDYLDRIRLRRYANRDVATALFRLAPSQQPSHQVQLLALAHRILRCSDKENFFIIPKDIPGRNGSTYMPVGKLWRCGSKLCSSCIAETSRMHRKQISDVLESYDCSARTRFWFITLTIPTPKASLSVTRQIVNRAWSLLRKRSFWRESVRGGVKSEEFTVVKGGFHYHLHLLIDSRFIPFSIMRRAWTDCVAEAWSRYIDSHGMRVMTSDGMLIVKIIELKSLVRGIQEVCKYITKSDSWLKLPESVLLDVALIRRWSRMFERFGSFRSNPEARDEPASSAVRATDDASSAGGIVHTSGLSDASGNQIRPYWRDRVMQISVSQYLHELDREIEVCRQVRITHLMREYSLDTVLTYNDFE